MSRYDDSVTVAPSYVLPVAATGATEFQNRSDDFYHAPLDHNTSSMRLLQILPSLSEKGLIQCRVQHHDLHSPGLDDNGDVDKPGTSVTYHCLSYTWGTGPRTCLILINEQRYLVRQNLWDFLSFLRQCYEEDGAMRLPGDRWIRPGFEKCPLIWIDAICIDQDNMVEKNHQVQQMGDIYKGAEVVLVWVGIGNYEWILTHEYWSRAWIAQEISLARYPLLLMNKDTWHVEYALGRMQYLIPASGGTKYAAVERILTYFGKRSVTSKYRSVLHGLDSFGPSRLCADIRDRIYSLLALFPDNDIAVDYDIPPRQLMQDLVASCRNPLCFCGVSVAAKALEIESVHDDREQSLYAEIELPKHYCVPPEGRMSGTCSRCHSDLPSAFLHDSGSYFCLRDICTSMHGHLFAENRDICESDASVDSASAMRTCGLHTLDCKESVSIDGIHVLAEHVPNKFPIRKWFFTLDALVRLAEIESREHPHGIVRLCPRVSSNVHVAKASTLRNLKRCL